jgi:hypothetical protein
MGQWTLYKFNSFAERMREDMNLGSDSFEFTLQDSAPSASSSVWADESANELADGNGYAGQAVSVLSSQTGGAYTLITSGAVEYTASGGAIGPAQHCIIRNTTLAGEPLCFYGVRDASLTIDSGSSATLIPDGTTLYSAP